MKFNVIVIISYLVINVFFAAIYWLIGIEYLGIEAGPGLLEEMLNSFYFSAQTFSTVGYGRINPYGHWINILSVTEMLIGMMYLALAAGILFARFSKPLSKIVFSKNAVIAPYRDSKGLMFRMANAKENMLLNVEAQVLMALELEEGGKKVRKFFELELERRSINLFALSWTVVHPIDDKSPIWKMEQEDFNETNAEIFILINGTNDTFGQTIHSRTSYKFDEVIWDARFVSIFENRKGITYVNLDEIGRYELTD
ncbi:ion channel [Bacteroidota bacterium]